MAGTAADDLGSAVRRSQLVAPDGTTYLSYRQTLTPRWWLVRIHLALGYLALAALAAASAATWVHAPTWLGIVSIVPFGLAIGYSIHYVHLFMHEAAHFNLDPHRRHNDLLANIAIGALVGMNVRPYRPTHFDHHRYIGTPRDTEISYFEPLDLRFVVEGLVGVKVLKAMANRNAAHSGDGSVPSAEDRGAARAALVAVAVSAALHVGFAALAAAMGWYGLAVAWALGAFTCYPFWAALRTLLEHRSERADRHTDYRTTDHGVVSRMFGVGPISSTFGMAGFNRHLLHHWDPQISYTRLADVERFLRATDAGRTLMSGMPATYPATFSLLYGR